MNAMKSPSARLTLHAVLDRTPPLSGLRCHHVAGRFIPIVVRDHNRVLEETFGALALERAKAAAEELRPLERADAHRNVR
jgi:hypothetical protein